MSTSHSADSVGQTKRDWCHTCRTFADTAWCGASEAERCGNVEFCPSSCVDACCEHDTLADAAACRGEA